MSQTMQAFREAVQSLAHRAHEADEAALQKVREELAWPIAVFRRVLEAMADAGRHRAELLEALRWLSTPELDRIARPVAVAHEIGSLRDAIRAWTRMMDNGAAVTRWLEQAEGITLAKVHAEPYLTRKLTQRAVEQQSTAQAVAAEGLVQRVATLAERIKALTTEVRVEGATVPVPPMPHKTLGRGDSYRARTSLRHDRR